MWQGSVVSIHIAKKDSAPMESLPAVRAVPGRGLEGDRYFLGTGFYSPKPSRLGLDEGDLAPAETRRNLATVGVPLNHLVDREFWVGPVLLVGTRLCEPCKHLEDLTQQGVMAGLIHRGGLRARILSEGMIRVGDVVRPKTA